ncbi:K02A2.6-like [Cordylochernes scorpioides]|uniref:K02A2.6-like n=1 Tax=Cordylochernes scorpioides TaxID=51811 RepID=A0ABY6KV74_9ARAC|nr:K02A2.6-like [Cordylochernes scorpioides]
MPGHRKRRQFKQTDAFTRGMVIGLKGAGWSIRQIAADTHLGASTVHRLWRRWLEQGNVAIYRNAGATRVTSARVDRRILREAVAAPQATCTAILQHVQDTLDHSISTRTISRRLVANGLHSCRPLRRLPLTPPNRRQHLEWCRARSTWMTEWHRVVFSDESRFCLSSDSRRVRVWRRRGERFNPAAIVERPTVRQRGIMVWGAIAYDFRSPLLRIQGTMTAQRYVDDVLRPVTLPYLQGVPNALYQQDNARPHTARISQQALQDVQMLPWPPYYPDLSPIEHVWDIIGRRLHALPQPRSEDELWQMVEREWRAIPQDAIRTLIDTLPRRVAACIAVRALKLHLRGKHFANDDEVQAEANHWLRRQDTAWYNSGIKILLQRYQNCLDRNIYSGIYRDEELMQEGRRTSYVVDSKQAAVSRGRTAAYRLRRCTSWKILEGSTKFCLRFCSCFPSPCSRCLKAIQAMQTQNQALQAQNQETREAIQAQNKETREALNLFSPVVLVKKKDGSTRYCVDYRKLNDITKKDSYPYPRIDATLDTFARSQWFSTLDLKSGYWQVEMHPDDKEKTAFTTGCGLWQFNVMPFGLCNAPATFERLMEAVLQGLATETCMVYLDDIIVFENNFEEHLSNIEKVFKRLEAANLKLSPKKCKLFKKEVAYLGHIISAEGFHRRFKAKTSLEDNDVPIDDTTTKPLFTPQEKGCKGTRDKFPRLR